MPRHRFTTVPELCVTQCHFLGKETSIIPTLFSIKNILNVSIPILNGNPSIKNWKDPKMPQKWTRPKIEKNFFSQISLKLFRSNAVVAVTPYFNFPMTLGRISSWERCLSEVFLVHVESMFFLVTKSAIASSSWQGSWSNLLRVSPAVYLVRSAVVTVVLCWTIWGQSVNFVHFTLHHFRFRFTVNHIMN